MKIISNINRPDYGNIIPGSTNDIPSGYDKNLFKKPAVTADVITITFINKEPHILLIQRKFPPYKDFWAIPGGFIEMSEDLHEAAKRELQEETGINFSKKEGIKYFDQLRTYGKPGRDPRDRVITVAYLAVIDAEKFKIKAADDAKDAAWVPLEKALESKALAFDHEEILNDAGNRVRELNFSTM